MQLSISRPQGLAVCLVGVAMAVAGCASSGSSGAPQQSTTSSARPAGGSTSTAPSTTGAPAPVVSTGQAHGGGDFCKLVAAASTSPAVGATSAADIQQRIDHVRAEEQQALDLAPSSIKGDVTVLFTASNAMYDSLAAVGFDYSKLEASDVAVLDTPAVKTAERHVTAYVSHVCRIS